MTTPVKETQNKMSFPKRESTEGAENLGRMELGWDTLHLNPLTAHQEVGSCIVNERNGFISCFQIKGSGNCRDDGRNNYKTSAIMSV